MCYVASNGGLLGANNLLTTLNAMSQLPLQSHNSQCNVIVPKALPQLSMQCHNSQCSVTTSKAKDCLKNCKMYGLTSKYVPWSQEWEISKMIVNHTFRVYPCFKITKQLWTPKQKTFIQMNHAKSSSKHQYAPSQAQIGQNQSNNHCVGFDDIKQCHHKVLVSKSFKEDKALKTQALHEKPYH